MKNIPQALPYSGIEGSSVRAKPLSKFKCSEIAKKAASPRWEIQGPKAKIY